VVVGIRRGVLKVEGIRQDRMESWVLRSAAFAVAISAFLLLYLFGVFWLDFVLVILFLVFHRPVEHCLVRAITKDKSWRRESN
jgi:hypothetical protein